MRILNTGTALIRTAVSSVVNATSHPVDTTARAVGLMKATAWVGVGLVRDRISAAPQQEQTPSEESTGRASTQPPTTAEDVAAEVKEATDGATETTPPKAPSARRAPARKAATEKSTVTPVTRPADEDPRNDIPGPDLAPYIPPAIDELPDPIVIVAE